MTIRVSQSTRDYGCSAIDDEQRHMLNSEPEQMQRFNDY